MISCDKIGITKNCGKILKGKIDPDEPSGQWGCSAGVLDHLLLGISGVDRRDKEGETDD